MSENQKLIEFRVVIIGDCSVGKTSLCKRFAKRTFSQDTVSTLGFDYEYKNLTMKDQKEIRLKIVDTAGQEKYHSLAKSFFKGADGVLTVFSVDNEDSFDNLDKWIHTYNENRDSDREKAPLYIVGNKIDLEKTIPDEKINTYVKENKLKLFYCCCSMDDPKINKVDLIFQTLAEEIYDEYIKKNIGGIKQKKSTIVTKKIDKKNDKNKKDCCLKV